ncbi:butyrophilin-like protein 2 [Sparus aurata]|uniref:butyrophilin-like protein 2 n=1 Tax=Sparus aurata TaxID=8175 RepID=UPI0011C0EEA4|nr:butyrophilin-like protein 2 [Sparus aurata]
MSSTILLIVLLSAHITGLISEQLLKATVGGSVLFPCSLPGYPPTFYWQDGERNVLFHWKDGDEIKEPNKYKNRSEIFRSEFSSGNFSFRLDNISPEDNNTTFFAYVKLDKQKLSEERCRSRLQVSAPYQHLVLTVNHTTNSATCSARGGYPAAQVSWKGLNRSSDEQQDLQDAETSPQEDPTEKTFSFTSSVNVTGLKSVTCIVYNRHSHESITETKKIPGLISEQLLRAAVGGSVLIPCSLPGNPLRFYWQEDQSPYLLCHWDGGKTLPGCDKYNGRFQVFTSEFSSGNISIRLDNISPEDDKKTFFAYVKFDEQIQSERRCESTLQVSAPYQDLVLTVNHTTNSAACRARGGYPAAQVSWKGLNRSSDEEQDLQDAETSLQQDPTEKTFSFTSSVNITGLKSVTCIVYNPHSHETVKRTVEIDTAAGENKKINVAAIAVPFVLVILVGAVLFYLWYKRQPQDPDLPNQSPIELHPQDRAQAEDQDQSRAPDPPSEPPIEYDPHDGAEGEDADAAETAQDPVQEEAADAPGETASLTGTPVGIRHRTKLSEDAAASPEKENLLK